MHINNTFHTMPLDYNDVVEEVVHQISKPVYQDILAHVEMQDVNLWGEHQPKGFLSCMSTLTLWKDIKDKSYVNLMNLHPSDLHVSVKSLNHNIQALRPVLASWGEKQIHLGRLREWESAAANVHKPSDLADVSLWMDSTDFPLEKWHGCSKKGPEWSFKLNKPGRRFMVIRDATPQIIKLYGGYSPKVYDSDFLAVVKRDFERDFEGAAIIADTHFHSAAKKLQLVKLYTPYPPPPTKKRKREGQDVGMLNHAQQHWNEQIHLLRARVESTFGEMSMQFEALATPFGEGAEQLDHVVVTAAGVYNAKHRHSHH